MERDEIKEMLLELRPDKPRKAKGRKQQIAVDEALKILDKYEELLKLITRAKRKGEL